MGVLKARARTVLDISRSRSLQRLRPLAHFILEVYVRRTVAVNVENYIGSFRLVN